MNRREARKQAFLLLFQYKFQPENMERLLSDFFNENKVGEQREYIDAVVRGTLAEIEEIDSLINEYSKGWRVDRISSVSLAALRIGIYEMKYMQDIPSAVSVNEAIALVKEFEGEEAAPFVNGILGKLKDDIG
ncbi:MAG: transcription antitermination factor NusB [Clostridia bacterium]|nr:transcription antitermination factor NusB [Clostridia bacterium]